MDDTERARIRAIVQAEFGRHALGKPRVLGTGLPVLCVIDGDLDENPEIGLAMRAGDYVGIADDVGRIEINFRRLKAVNAMDGNAGEIWFSSPEWHFRCFEAGILLCSSKTSNTHLEHVSLLFAA